ncbi:MAG: hypothetical protein WEC14_07040, partial [Chloroflexota bacterium]
MIKGNTKRRRLAWLSAAFFTGAALLMPATIGSALAIEGHQTPPISSDDSGFQGSDKECEGTPDNTVIWHFVQTQPAADSGNLTATFTTAGTIVQGNAVSPADTLHWYVSTGKPDTLTAFSSNVGGTGNLVLSHICQGDTVTTTTTVVTTTTTDETTTTTGTGTNT